MFDDDEINRTSVADPVRVKLHAISVLGGRAVTHSLPDGGDVPIGRMGRGITLDHSTISRMHAILRMGPPLTIEDLGSVNGTYVRELRIPPGKQVPVANGDLVRVGSVYLIVGALPAER